MSKLHLYPQQNSHSDAWLVGDRESLMAIRDAINRVLEGPVPAACVRSFCEDGEGYAMIVMAQDGPWVWERLMLPYARLEDRRVGATHPWSELDPGLYRALLRAPRPNGGG